MDLPPAIATYLFGLWALGNVLTFGPNNQAEARRLTFHAKLMGAGGGVVSVAGAQVIIKNGVNLPTDEEALEDIKQSHITANTLLPDTHMLKIDSTRSTPSLWRTTESSRS